MSNEIIAQETEYIKEAMSFIGMQVDRVDLSISTEQNPAVITWVMKLTELDFQLSGMYELVSEANTRLSVIMSVGLARHTYGQLVFDMLRMSEKAMHSAPGRNSVPEIAVRFLIKAALQKNMDGAAIHAWLDKQLHIKENITEQTLYYHALKQSKRRN